MLTKEIPSRREGRTSTSTETVSCAPVGTSPKVQRTMPSEARPPRLADTNDTSGGRVSTSAAFNATAKPLFA